MKFRIVMKSPDTVYNAIKDAVVDEQNRMTESVQDMDSDEFAALVDSREEEILVLCKKWFYHLEYVTIEIDTVNETARVVPLKERV